jgi:HEAT repeat protein
LLNVRRNVRIFIDPHARPVDLDCTADLIMAIEKGIPDILNLLTDKNYEVRKAAVLAITDFSKQRKIPFL